MSAPLRVTVLLNTRAGRSTVAVDELERLLGAESVHVVEVEPGTLRAQAEHAAAAGATLLGVAGGDGSLRTAAAALAGTRTALLPVPTGTLNHFARRCGIPTIVAAAAALRTPHVRALPIGDLDGDVFLNTLTLGEYARTVRIRERWRGWLGKWPAALLGVGATVLRARRIALRMETEGDVLERRTAFVWIGIGWGSFPRVHEALERRSSPDLEVTVLRSPSRRATAAFVARVGWRMLRGKQPVRDAALDVLHTRALTITARRTIDATADGEVLRLKPPLHVRVRDDALRVVMAEDAE